MHDFFIFGQLLFQEPKKNTTSAKIYATECFFKDAAGIGATAKPAHASEERSDECGGWSESGMLDSLVFGWFQTSQKAAHIKKISRVLQKQFLIQH